MSNYIVLTEDSVSKVFTSHGQAFGHCENLKPRLCKAVYVMRDSKTLGALNVFGGFDNQYMMEQIHRDQFNFVVV